MTYTYCPKCSCTFLNRHELKEHLYSTHAYIDCPHCKGTGEMIHIRLECLENCDYCDGKGQVPDTPKVRKQIAKGDFNNVPSYYDSAETHPDHTYKRTEVDRNDSQM